MLKSAKNQDPIQLKLRQNKKVWNKEVSNFIDDLISFKKTMNGTPSKFAPEKGTIKDPILADPATIIGSLAGDFQDIAQKGNAIIEEQINYSKNRRKSQPKNPVIPTVQTPNDLSKQLAAFENKYELVAEGSNFLTRFITRLTTPSFGFGEAARIRRARMALLDACVNTYKILGKLQVEIVKTSKESIQSSNKLLYEAWNNWSRVVGGLNAYKQNMPNNVPDSGGKIPKPQKLVEEKQKESKEKPVEQTIPENKDNTFIPEDPNFALARTTIESAKTYIADYKKNYSPNLGGQDAPLEEAITKFKVGTPNKLLAAQKVNEEYTKLLAKLNASFNTSALTLGEIFKKKKDSVTTEPNQLETVAQAFLKKWVGKTIHKLKPFDTTSDARLNIFGIADSIRKLLDQTMNSLEDEMNIDHLTELTEEIKKLMSSLRMLMRSLHLTNPIGKDNDISFFDRMTREDLI